MSDSECSHEWEIISTANIAGKFISAFVMCKKCSEEKVVRMSADKFVENGEWVRGSAWKIE